MFSGASVAITGGIFNNATNMNIIQSKRGIDLLMEFVATDALHDSKELYDAPKCHPHTRIAVLDEIMNWVVESDPETQEDFIMWFFGPAGAGKSAIAKKIAELAAEMGLLIGSFFFSRTSPTRNTQDRLVTTLAYQMTVSIPGIRTHIEEAIERDRAIVHKNIQVQIDTLLIKPFQSAAMNIIPSPKLLIIDGLDECSDRNAQVAILEAISHSFAKHKLPVIFLVVSRPETDLVSSFNGKEPLRSVHRRLALDDTYHPDDDIRRFFSDKFEDIRSTHRLRSTIPFPWPTKESLETLVKKSSGQFIYAATVVRYVESNRHRPVERLNIILKISPRGTINPFAELDVLYKQILFSMDDIQLALRVLSLYASSPDLASLLDCDAQHFLSLEEGDIGLALIDLSSIVSYDESSGRVKILHASFVDFLSDKHRSDEFYIDMASSRADFACRTLQCVKGPDGIRAGDMAVFVAGFIGDGCDQLRNEILNFDLDAFISAAPKMVWILWTFSIWISTISRMGFEDADEQLLIHQYRNSFESRIQKYQSDRRLQLLLTLGVVMDYLPFASQRQSIQLDILLGTDDQVRLVDRNALSLRLYSEPYNIFFTTILSDITSRYVDGDRYTSAALHCMHFLSNPPELEYSKKVNFGKGVTFYHWKETCETALELLFELLERANTSPELVQFLSDHDVNQIIHNKFLLFDIWRLDTSILAFLSRGGVCVNRRIISAIRRARVFKSAKTKGRKQSYRQTPFSDFSKSISDWEGDESSDETDSDMYETADDGSEMLSVSDLIT